MQVFLTAHPAISFLPEVNLIRRFVLSEELACVVSGEVDRSRLVKRFESDPKLVRLPYSWSELVEEIPPDVSPVEFKEELLARIVSRHQEEFTRYVGYKDALLIESAEAILRRWPKSRIVHIIRDPRDVLASRKKADWSRHYPDWRNIIAGRIQLRIARMCKATDVGARMHEVKYEDLLDEPETVAQGLCQFLELDYSDDMLGFSSQASGLVFEDELQWKKNLFAGLLRGNSGKWKTELRPKEIALVEKSYRLEFAKRGYESSGAFDSLSSMEKLTVMGRLGWIKLVQAAYFLKRRLFD